MLRCNLADFLAVHFKHQMELFTHFLRVLGKNTWIMQQHSEAVVGLNEIFGSDCAYWVILGERRVREGRSEGEPERGSFRYVLQVLVLIPVEAGAKCNYGATEAGSWGWSMGRLVLSSLIQSVLSKTEGFYESHTNATEEMHQKTIRLIYMAAEGSDNLVTAEPEKWENLLVLNMSNRILVGVPLT